MQVRGDVLPPPHGTNITVVIVNNEKSKTEQALPHINHTANKGKKKISKCHVKSYKSLTRTNI